MRGQDESAFQAVLLGVNVSGIRVDSISSGFETLGYGGVDWLVEITDVSGPPNKTLTLFFGGFAGRSGSGVPNRTGPLTALNDGAGMPLDTIPLAYDIDFNVGTGNTFTTYVRTPAMSRGVFPGFSLNSGTATLTLSRALRHGADLLSFS